MKRKLIVILVLLGIALVLAVIPVKVKLYPESPVETISVGFFVALAIIASLGSPFVMGVVVSVLLLLFFILYKRIRSPR